MKKSIDYINLFFINSIHSLILLIFMSIFFFLLDGINTFEFISIQERITQMIWCTFFVLQIGLLKIAEVFSSNPNEKHFIYINYMLVAYVFLAPLSSSLLFTSALSWIKSIYFIYSLGLVTSIRIRELLLICLITFLSGFIRFYHSFIDSTVVFCFIILLAVHLSIPIVAHIVLYFLAKQIAYIKQKPLRAFDNIESYFHELEKRAILIRNNLIYCQQNNISVDILGNNLFEYEVNDGIKKIKTVNKVGLYSYESECSLNKIQCETPFDVSDVNYSSFHSFHIEIEKNAFQNEERFMNTKKNTRISNTGSSSISMDKFINSEKGYHTENDKIRTKDKKKSKKNVNENDKKENKNWIHEYAMDKTDDRKYSFLDKHESVEKNLKKMSNMKLSNMNELENDQINDDIEKMNSTKFDIYNNKVVQKHFSLLRNGLVKFNRKRNILLSEELKKKINYIYFDKNGNIKQSKIIPLYVLERHNLSDVSKYLKSEKSKNNEENNYYYQLFTLLNEKQKLFPNSKGKQYTNLNLLSNVKTVDSIQDMSIGIDKNPHKYKKNHKQNLSIKEKGNNNSKIVNIFNSDLIRSLEKRKLSSYKLKATSKSGGIEYDKGSYYNEHNSNTNDESQDIMKANKKSTRIFYLMDHDETEEKNEDEYECSDFIDGKKNINKFHSLLSNNIGNNFLIKNNHKFYINKLYSKKNTLYSEESSSYASSCNYGFFVDDAVDNSVEEEHIESDENSKSEENSSTSLSASPTIKTVCKCKKSILRGEKNQKKNRKNFENAMYEKVEHEKKSMNSITQQGGNSMNSKNDKMDRNVGKCWVRKKKKSFYFGEQSKSSYVFNEHVNKDNIETSEKNDESLVNHDDAFYKNSKENEQMNKKEIKEYQNKESSNIWGRCLSKKDKNKKIDMQSRCYQTILSKRNESDILTKKKHFFKFYDFISVDYMKNPDNVVGSKNKTFFDYIKMFFLSLKCISHIFEKIKLCYDKNGTKKKYWENYNDVFYKSEWKYSMQDNELEYILNYKNFKSWYDYWVKNILFNYFKRTRILILVLLILNVLIVYLQMHIFCFLFKHEKINDNDNFNILHRIDTFIRFYIEKMFGLKAQMDITSIDNIVNEDVFRKYTYIRIPIQLAINILLVIPSFIIKSSRNINILHICSILNCLVNIFFGMIDITYSLNEKIYNTQHIYKILNHFNVFDIYLIGKLITSIFIIPFITNFSESKTCLLAYFSCFSYITTFYYTFSPLSFSIKLMFITNFILIIAISMVTVHFTRLVAKSRKMLFVKYVLPYFIYLTFLSTSMNIHKEVQDGKKEQA
ncbi:hypothetical protein YYG_02804 [Plasmodium vinckei petteri]|uniref:Uncharacterized protein n=1 Tax=Plasmodium vinckei petteri TaxID=138298 RepID=W7ALC5_PLAVN|nr:hypothetical protein YYG_02804 [Plasmodium vinckei petteri]CAD2103160.1 conserved Plasmodium protein, unknown function [Plasmodium vinckei petteri]